MFLCHNVFIRKVLRCSYIISTLYGRWFDARVSLFRRLVDVRVSLRPNREVVGCSCIITPIWGRLLDVVHHKDPVWKVF